MVLGRAGLAGLSVVALMVFALYAANLAAHAGEVDAPELIVVPSKGADAPVVAGNVAPGFTLPTLDGRPVSLAQFAGRPVWINVWASWCAPCRAEMPDLNAVYQDLVAKGTAGESGNGLVLLTISLGESPDVARRYLDSTRYQIPVLVDPGFAFTEGYRITGLPTHYFISRNGAIQSLAIGGLKPNAMRARLAKIL